MRGLFFLLTTLMLVSCGHNNGNKTGYIEMAVKHSISHQQQDVKKLMEVYCYACHGTETKGDQRLAPPMFAIKKHYLNEGMSENEFVDLIVDWAREPSKEKSRMPGAVERFGLMPYQSFPEDSLKLIASFIFHNELERPGGHGQGHGMGKGKGKHRDKQ